MVFINLQRPNEVVLKIGCKTIVILCKMQLFSLFYRYSDVNTQYKGDYRGLNIIFMKHIDTYSTIYNIDIVVANKQVTWKELKKRYTYSDGRELIDDKEDTAIASTSYCKDINTGKYIILVKYNKDSEVKGVNKRLDLINTVSHEATHVVMAIYDFIGEKVYPADSNELLANTIGWVAECIYNTWTKK